jgi:hypothetical protein
MRPEPRITVSRDDEVWHWVCRCCLQSQWRSHHKDALADARRHLESHRSFGFCRGVK